MGVATSPYFKRWWIMIDIGMLQQPELGAECRKIREDVGLTMGELAERANVTRMSIYNFEIGKRQNLDIFREYYKLYRGVEK